MMNFLNKYDKSGRILAVLTIVMTIVFVISAVSLIISIRADRIKYPLQANGFVNLARDGRYAEIIEAWHDNISIGVDSEEYHPYYALAEYCEKASFYKVYDANNDTAGCERILSEMKELSSRMGEAKVLTEDVNKQFDIPLID